MYLVGRKFTIYTDHNPLMYLFGENKGIPMTASARVTRWALLLSGYEYSVQYKPGKELANADGLSRLPLSDVCQEDATPTELINLIEHLNSTPISVSEIIKWAYRDKTLLRMRHLIRHGWPEVGTKFKDWTQTKEAIDAFQRKMYKIASFTYKIVEL